MEYVKLGTTGLDVSPIAIGAMSYGEHGATPIKPVSGRQWTVSDISDRAIVATRETVSGKPDPAVRIFTGNAADKEVGDRFDSYHRVNRMPCGVWTVVAVAEAGRVKSGQLPAGTHKLRVNELG
jgi:hypothetical protein